MVRLVGGEVVRWQLGEQRCGEDKKPINHLVGVTALYHIITSSFIIHLPHAHNLAFVNVC